MGTCSTCGSIKDESSDCINLAQSSKLSKNMLDLKQGDQQSPSVPQVKSFPQVQLIGDKQVKGELSKVHSPEHTKQRLNISGEDSIPSEFNSLDEEYQADNAEKDIRQFMTRPTHERATSLEEKELVTKKSNIHNSTAQTMNCTAQGSHQNLAEKAEGWSSFSSPVNFCWKSRSIKYKVPMLMDPFSASSILARREEQGKQSAQTLPRGSERSESPGERPSGRFVIRPMAPESLQEF